MEAHTGVLVGVSHVFCDGLDDGVQMLERIAVSLVLNVKVNLVLLDQVVIGVLRTQRDVVIYFLPNHLTCLVGPASCHIGYRVTPSTQQNQRD